MFDGSYNPIKLKHSISDLNTGASYAFQIQSVNHNGVESLSSNITYKICGKPGMMIPPQIISSTISTLWRTSNVGECPISGFQLFRDRNSGNINIQVDVPSIDNKPAFERAHSDLNRIRVHFQIQHKNNK